MPEQLVIDSIMLKPFSELPTGTKTDTSKKWYDWDWESSDVVRFVGVGSAACDIVRYLSEHTHHVLVDFIAVDQDLEALKRSEAMTQVLLKNAGSEPTVAANAVAPYDLDRLSESADLDEIRQPLAGSDMVFVLVDLGERSALGVALDLAQVARASGALTIGIGLQPLSSESQDRSLCAQYGLTELEAKVDALFAIDPNRLLPQTSCKLSDVRAEVNSVVLHILLGFIEPCAVPGYINLGFSDVLAVIKGRGLAAIGFAQATGDNFVVDAVKQAVHYPLLESVDLKKSCGLLVHVQVNRNFPIAKWEQINREIMEYFDEEADCKYGIVFDDEIAEDQIAITILIAGISGDEAPKNENQMAAVRSNASSRRKVPSQVNDDGADPDMPHIFRKKV